jgi:lupus La protein
MADVKDPDPLSAATTTEEKPTDNAVETPNTTKDPNASAAADVKGLLAELKAEGGLDQPEDAEEKADDANGVGKVEQPKEETTATVESGEKKEEKPETEAASQDSASNSKSESKEGERKKTGYERSSRDYDSRRGGPKKPFRDYQANVKTDFSSVKESNDPDAIRKQVYKPSS